MVLMVKTTYQRNIAHNTAKLVTLLMNKEFALYTLKPLSAQAPDTVVTVRTERFPVKPLRLNIYIFKMEIKTITITTMPLPMI